MSRDTFSLSLLVAKGKDIDDRILFVQYCACTVNARVRFVRTIAFPQSIPFPCFIIK
jgi:hypothetical protein